MKKVFLLILLLVVAYPVAAQDTTEENRALVRQIFESLNSRDMEALTDAFADETAALNYQSFLEAFPDAQFTVENLIAEGDFVVAQVQVTGSQQAEYLGVPAAGQVVNYDMMILFRFENGKIVQTLQTDSPELIYQIGLAQMPVSNVALELCQSGQRTAPDGLGPYYIPEAPFTTQLYQEGMTGEKLVISGTVLGPNCEPLADAVIDVWQADANGVYDFSEDFILRARLNADANGQYQFETVLPGLYETRPRHIHIMVTHPSLPQPFVSQIYFASDERAQGIPNAIPLTETGQMLSGVFDIIVQ